MNESENMTREVAAPVHDNAEVEAALNRRYEAGFVTDIESTTLPPGLNEDTVRQLSAIKGEPEWMTEWRLAAYRHWLTMPEPDWAKLEIAPIDYQAVSYYRHRRPVRSRSTRSIRSCWKRTKSWAYRCMSARVSPVWLWMPCSIRSLSAPPSARNWRKPA